MIGSLMVDGQYGLQTASVLYDFCEKKGIPFNGVIDAKICSALLKYSIVQQSRKELQDLKYIIPVNKPIYEAKQDKTYNASRKIIDSSMKKMKIEEKSKKKEVAPKKIETKTISFNPNESVDSKKLEKANTDTITYLQNPEAKQFSQNMFQTFQEKGLLINGPGGYPQLQAIQTPQKELLMTQIVANDSLRKDKKPLISTDGSFGTQTYRALEYLSKKMNVEPIQAILSNSIFSKVVEYAKEKMNSYSDNTMYEYKEKINSFDLSKTIKEVCKSYPDLKIDPAIVKALFTVETRVSPQALSYDGYGNIANYGLWQIATITVQDMAQRYNTRNFSDAVKKICWFNNVKELQTNVVNSWNNVRKDPLKNAALAITALALKQREMASQKALFDVPSSFNAVAQSLFSGYNIVIDKKIFDNVAKRIQKDPTIAKTLMAYNWSGYQAFLYSVKVLYLAELYR